ncbi:hypothetical protein PoB_003500600 [Plakobranchus ocellatus]|uniref:Uncharacterized protein n=1 Tax=Plakobranchus ocellatus TaxID=259542 RepID=A0AAV4ABI7_9GAST|nr:hypothetical protein PoB_003500600 [Plakobranchus ocellatus]
MTYTVITVQTVSLSSPLTFSDSDTLSFTRQVTRPYARDNKSSDKCPNNDDHDDHDDNDGDDEDDDDEDDHDDDDDDDDEEDRRACPPHRDIPMNASLPEMCAIFNCPYIDGKAVLAYNNIDTDDETANTLYLVGLTVIFFFGAYFSLLIRARLSRE